MTLVAIYYNPPTTQDLSLNSTTHHSKWKRGLAFISPKHYYNKKKYKSSPTTVAAATEKVLCHTKQQQQVKCEDLTAQEFAKMAGIKIKTTDDEEEINNVDQTISSYKHDMLTVDEPMMTQMTSFSTRTALSSKSCHQIWESDFWQTHPNTSKLCKLNTENSNLSTSTNSNDTLLSNKGTVIQKGRFKICVGQQDNDESEPVSQHHHVVLEWKRKRSNSSATNIITHKK